MARGRALEAQKNYAEAETEFVMALASDWNCHAALRELGTCAYARKRYMKAMGFYLDYLDRVPGDTAIAKFLDGIKAGEEQKRVKESHGGYVDRRDQPQPDHPWRKLDYSDMKDLVAWEGDIGAAKAKAKATGKHLLVLAHNICTRPGVSNRNDFTALTEDRAKGLLYEVFNQPRYAAWINEHFVAARTRRRYECWDLVMELGGPDQDTILNTDRSVVVASAKLDDWRSEVGYAGPDLFMYFLIKANRDFQTPRTQPRKEIATIEVTPPQGSDVMVFTNLLVGPRNYYFSFDSDKNFFKANALPVLSPMVKIRGLAARRYYWYVRPVDEAGHEGRPRLLDYATPSESY